MTTAINTERYTSKMTIAKIITFLRAGGKAKLGKAVSDIKIDFSGEMDKAPGEYVVVVPLEGISELYWRATTLETLKSFVGVNINGTEVSLAE